MEHVKALGLPFDMATFYRRTDPYFDFLNSEDVVQRWGRLIEAGEPDMAEYGKCGTAACFAGAASIILAEGWAHPYLQIAERLTGWSPDRLRGRELIYSSAREMLRAYRQQEEA